MADIIKVEEDFDGVRLDKWIQKHYENVTFGQVQKLLRTGQIRIDGKRAKGDARLAVGQEIRIPPQMESIEPAEKKISKKDEEFIQSLILYQDEHIIALNKPAGIATQGGSKVTKHIDGMLDGLKFDYEERPHMVHRLDKETSGILMIARTQKAARLMGEMFRDKTIRKYYWALTIGVPDPMQGVVTTFIDKEDEDGYEKMATNKKEKGKKSVTYYSVMENAGRKLAWVAFWPRTGRKHQIRLHSLEMKTPLLGDYKYCMEQEILEGESELPKRLYLHARRIIMRHPITQKKLDITAPLGDEMKKAWKFFGFPVNDKTDPFEELEL